MSPASTPTTGVIEANGVAVVEAVPEAERVLNEATLIKPEENSVELVKLLLPPMAERVLDERPVFDLKDEYAALVEVVSMEEAVLDERLLISPENKYVTLVELVAATKMVLDESPVDVPEGCDVVDLGLLGETLGPERMLLEEEPASVRAGTEPLFELVTASCEERLEKLEEQISISLSVNKRMDIVFYLNMEVPVAEIERQVVVKIVVV